MSRRREGFALLATLWLLVAIGAVGLEWGLRARDQRRVAMNTVDAAAARAAAEAGVAQALARLNYALIRAGTPAPEGTSGLMPDPLSRSDPWHDLGAIVPDTEGAGAGMGWRLHLEDAGTRLNLNLASEDEFRRFLVALRVDAGRADRIAQSVSDWRDADDAHRARGAERDWYLRAGRLVLPRDGPFGEVAELRYVRDVTSDVYERAAPLLTVHGTGRVNIMAAPRPVLLALPGLGEEAVQALLRRRLESRPMALITDLAGDLSPTARAQLERELPRLLAQTTTETAEVWVSSEGWVAGSPVRVQADAVVRRGPSRAILSQVEVTP